MKRFNILLPCSIFVLLLISAAGAQTGEDNVSIVVPAKSVAAFAGKILPYKIDLGKGFKGSFLIESIDDIQIKDDQIFFSPRIRGKDVQYEAKIGNSMASVALGNIDLAIRWRASFRYEKDKGILYIRPHMVDSAADKKQTQGEALLSALFLSLSGVEYPFEIKDIDPVAAELMGNSVTVNFEISGIFTQNDSLVVQIIPIPKADGKKG
ncbi:MAG: hypothetical protein C4530_00355 [Desulfobacteraceae bacterium]|nr:MAG: hypothetical protein C4530_00355 [Desulfobacteraceae bacterium]